MIAISNFSSPSSAPQQQQEQQHAVGQQLTKRLIAGGLFFGLLFSYCFFASAKHDPLWWHHAGISANDVVDASGGGATPKTRRNYHSSSTSTTSGRSFLHRETLEESIETLQRKHDDLLRSRYSIPINGSAFIADYDVSKIVPLPDPPLTKEKPRYLFNYMKTETSRYKFQYVSSKPMVAWVPNFLTDVECDAIIAVANKTMVRSQVVPHKDSKEKNTLSEVRTSSQTWLAVENPAAKSVVSRILDLTGFAQGSSEMLQVLRYEKGQKYDAHMDAFDPRLYGPQTSNRAVTVYLYLTTVEEGGYTQFPRADGKPYTSDFTSCQAGLKVRPVKGTIAVFYDMTPTGDLDEYSLHGGCKPVIGTKWGGTLWLRVPTGGK